MYMCSGGRIMYELCIKAQDNYDSQLNIDGSDTMHQDSFL